MLDVLLKGNIYDGLNNPSFTGFIGLKDSKIFYVGQTKPHLSFRKFIDCSKYVICPGFIDIHSHSDTFLIVCPTADNKIFQGVTTEVIGNCGVSATPLYGEYRDYKTNQWRKYGPDIKWHSFSEYVDILRDVCPILNVVPLVGYGNIRGGVVGFSSSIPDRKEIQSMQSLAVGSIQQGAYGISSGLIYPPCSFADKSEIMSILSILKDDNIYYSSHIRDEGDDVIEAVKELLDVARMGIKSQISHLKVCWERNRDKSDIVFSLIEESIKSGIKLGCDRYPYNALNTDLDVFLPPEYQKIPKEKRIKALKSNCSLYSEYINDKYNTCPQTIIGSANDSDIIGKTVGYFSQKWGLSFGACIVRILIDYGPDIQVSSFFGREDDLIQVLRKPYISIGSDSSLRTMKGKIKIGHPHPRTFGTFPRVLSKYCGRGKLEFAEAIYKMTGLPARQVGIEDRGVIKEGYWADLVVLDKDNLCDNATYENPYQYSSGIQDVIVNGSIALEKGILSSERKGQVLLKTV